MRVKGGDDQVDEMDGEGEIKHELRARYQEKNEDGTGICQQSARGDGRCSLPSQTVQYPDEPQGPAHSGVAAQSLPAKQQIQTDILARNQGREDNEHAGACVVGELEEDNLRRDAGRGEIGERTGPWRATSAGHECVL